MADGAGLVSPVEAKLDASVRPLILRLRARTPYPRRRAAARGDSVRLTQLDGLGGSSHQATTGKAVSHGHARSGC